MLSIAGNIFDSILCLERKADQRNRSTRPEALSESGLARLVLYFFSAVLAIRVITQHINVARTRQRDSVDGAAAHLLHRVLDIFIIFHLLGLSVLPCSEVSASSFFVFGDEASLADHKAEIVTGPSLSNWQCEPTVLFGST